MDREWQTVWMWGQQKEQQKKEGKMARDDGIEVVRSSISQHIYPQLLKTCLIRKTMNNLYSCCQKKRVNKIIAIETPLSTSHTPWP